MIPNLVTVKLTKVVALTREGQLSWRNKLAKRIAVDFVWDEFTHRLIKSKIGFESINKFKLKKQFIDTTEKLCKIIFYNLGYGKTLIKIKGFDEKINRWVYKGKGYIILIPLDKDETDYKIYEKDLTRLERYGWFKG